MNQPVPIFQFYYVYFSINFYGHGSDLYHYDAKGQFFWKHFLKFEKKSQQQSCKRKIPRHNSKWQCKMY